MLLCFPSAYGVLISPSALSLPFAGREVEEAAMWQQIALHEAYPNGRPIPHKWSGKELEAAYAR